MKKQAVDKKSGRLKFSLLKRTSMKLVFLILVFSATVFAQPLEMLDNVVPVAVIGSGPAGLSAALVTGKDKVHTVVFQGARPGGPLNAQTCMGNWPGSVKGKGRDVMARLFEQVQKVKVVLSNKSIVDVDFSEWPFLLKTDDGEIIHALSVVVAAGATPRYLKVSGEERFLNSGIETSLYSPDAVKLAGKRVAVVGGGIDAVKKAKIVAKQAGEVFLLVRGPQLQKPRWVKKIAAKVGDKVKIIYNTRIEAVVGDETGLTAVDVSSEGKRYRLNIDALILALGIEPNTSLFADYLACDEQGFLLLEGRTQKTNIAGVVAAGTVVDGRYRQAAISSGDGMKAGYDVLEFLRTTPLFTQPGLNLKLYD